MLWENNFYRPNDPTNSAKALKEASRKRALIPPEPLHCVMDQSNRLYAKHSLRVPV